MRTITLEEHFTTRDYIKATGAYGGEQATGYFGQLQPKMLDIGLEPHSARIAAMDEAGIDLQVLSAAAMDFDSLDAATATSLATTSNDQLAAAIAAHPTRLSGFALLDLQQPERAAQELDRCVTKLGLLGALISGTSKGKFLDAPEFTPVLEAAVHLGVPIYLHPAPPPKPVMDAYFSGLPEELAMSLSIAGWGWHAETGLHTLRMICAGVFDRLPSLQMIIGHMGEGLPYALARSSGILSRAAHLRQPVADYFQTNITVTTSGYFTLEPFICAMEVIGLDRLMFSVDYPFSPNTHGRDFLALAATVLDTAGLASLTHGNAERVLRLPPVA